MQFAHGIKVGEIALAIVRDGVLVIKHEHRVNHVALFRRAVVGQLHRLADRFQAGALRVIRQALVAAVRVGPDGVCHTPVRHGVIGVESGSFLVRSDRLREVETPGHSQALIEERLRVFYVCRNRGRICTAARNHNGEWFTVLRSAIRAD